MSGRPPRQRNSAAGLDSELEETRRVNPSSEPSFAGLLSARLLSARLLSARLSRRNLLRAGGTAAAVGAFVSLTGCDQPEGGQSVGPYGFVPVGWASDPDLRLPPGYRADILLRWGDSLGAGAPTFKPYRLTAADQEQQFGYNCDYTAFFPITPGGSDSLRGLLAVNHEFTLAPLMHPNSPFPDELSAEQLLADIAAQGMSIVEVARGAEGWRYHRKSRFNRRITPHTAMRFDGPATGHPRLMADGQDGIHTRGTWNNCAGGTTPWGTVLTAEENINLYFDGNPDTGPEAENHARFGLDGNGRFGWHRAERRWRLDQSPSYPLNGGWIVEVDPYNPASVPVKHTALGRMKHEGCTVVVNGDGRIACYMGDDQPDEYIYRYLSRQRYAPGSRSGATLLSDGELSVGRFDGDGAVEWIPLVFGQGPLSPANGFRNQGDLVLDVRRAADLVKATPMDRPEGICVDSNSGRVYCALTGNTGRTSSHPANPRAPNRYGHILELTPPGGDHSAMRYRWGIFLLAGPNGRQAQILHPQSDDSSYFIHPDNLTAGPDGNLWIATDGASSLNLSDALMVCGLEGGKRQLPSRFLSAPTGAEVTGPSFTPDGETLFCSIQHPGWSLSSSFEKPDTRWPDFQPGIPPRPSVIAVTRRDGGALTD